MTPQRWARIKEVFNAALDTPESQRPQVLEAACGKDAELRAEVEKLLAGNAQTSLESPVASLCLGGAKLSAGDAVAQYRIEVKLGEGGMGVVYRAHDTRLDREVALKVLRSERSADLERTQRLIQEARAASALNHPNIVTVYEIGSESDVEFIAMEFVEGRPLAHAIQEKGLAVPRTIDYAIEISSALEKAHASGVIHRDLKPANVMLTTDGHVKLLDFGIARRAPVNAEQTVTLTAEGQIAGTVGYMSPEQIRGLHVDRRSDLFSLGVVLYEMVTGERPFLGNTAADTCNAILNDPPRDFGESAAPSKLKTVIRKLLEKEPADRYQSAGDVHHELQELQASLAPSPPLKLSKNAWIAVTSLALVAMVISGWFWRKSSRESWALEQATPEIMRLVDAGEFVKAATLTREARSVLPKDPTLASLWVRATGEVSMSSVPPGADVSIRLYRGDPGAWESIGKTPLRNVRVPRDDYVWRVAKPGFATAYIIGQPPGVPAVGYRFPFEVTWSLRPQSSVPPEMVVVAGGIVRLAYPLNQAPRVRIADFLIDRHEVTNEEYKKFVDAGGYHRPEFWKQPFLRDGQTIPWETAIASFHDITGRPGPATWEVGDYPEGKGKHPVAGVSWYEAAAYAEFAGKSLPTAYHWTRASQATQGAGANGLVAQSTGFTPLITPGSNFRATGTRPVETAGALSGFGTWDMAGNVKEWVWNEGRDAQRLILGGGFGEPEYQFNHTDASSPWDRRPNFGFRCVKLDAPPAPEASAHIEVIVRDYWSEQPVPDDVFKAYSALYTYDKGDLNAQVQESVATPGGKRDKITFDAAYGAERLSAYLFLPNTASPPFQTVVFFPGAGAFLSDKIDLASVEDQFEFLLKSGRALIVPTYKGSYERRDAYQAGGQPPGLFRDHAIAWAKDLSRSLDYLETRKEIDSTRVAYLGASLGGAEAPIMAVIEKRIKTVIISSGGFQLRRDLPEVDPLNFVAHVSTPVLMLSGRYDATFPLTSSQDPLFYRLGTPEKDKKHVVYEGGHGTFPRPDAVREVLDWLDKYLGLVRQ